MKKRFAAALLTGVFCLVLSGAATVLAEDRTMFYVGFDPEYPPYSYLDEETGDYTGFDLELARAVADLEGWDLEEVPVDWNEKDANLEEGIIDCIWSGFTIDGREDDYAWSLPYMDSSQVVIVKKSSGITQLAQLKGQYVGVQQDSAAMTLLEQEDENGRKELADTFAALMPYPDYVTGFTELKAGEIDALAVDLGVAAFLLQGDDDFRILEEELSKEQYAVGFLLGNEALRDRIDADLLALADDGTLMRIAREYGLEEMLCIGR